MSTYKKEKSMKPQKTARKEFDNISEKVSEQDEKLE